VGEGAAALPLIHRIQRENPSTTILVTGGTLVADKWRRHQYPDNIILQVRQGTCKRDNDPTKLTNDVKLRAVCSHRHQAFSKSFPESLEA